jgi:hypothetical protein
MDAAPMARAETTRVQYQRLDTILEDHGVQDVGDKHWLLFGLQKMFGSVGSLFKWRASEKNS